MKDQSITRYDNHHDIGITSVVNQEVRVDERDFEFTVGGNFFTLTASEFRALRELMELTAQDHHDLARHGPHSAL